MAKRNIQQDMADASTSGIVPIFGLLLLALIAVTLISMIGCTRNTAAPLSAPTTAPEPSTTVETLATSLDCLSSAALDVRQHLQAFVTSPAMALGYPPDEDALVAATDVREFMAARMDTLAGCGAPQPATIGNMIVPPLTCQEDEVIYWTGNDQLGCIPADDLPPAWGTITLTLGDYQPGETPCAEDEIFDHVDQVCIHIDRIAPITTGGGNQ